MIKHPVKTAAVTIILLLAFSLSGCSLGILWNRSASTTEGTADKSSTTQQDQTGHDDKNVEVVFCPADHNQVSQAEMEAILPILEDRLDNIGIMDRDISIDYSDCLIKIRFKQTMSTQETSAAMSALCARGLLTFKDEAGNILLDGTDIQTAVAEKDQQNSECVLITFTAAGAGKFAEVTAANIGQKLTISMDDCILVEPVIKQAISGGTCLIASLDDGRAQTLAAEINAGALPFLLLVDQINFSSRSTTLP
ncbi:MAG TPA: hypothetical protein DD640_09500 [Clostridiales bacterium]|nr:hypothetical protein [Clostridiales bacterium]